MKKLLLLSLFLLGGLLVHSQAGTLDPGFAGKGWTSTDFIKANHFEESVLQVLRQADGSYILLVNAGYTSALTRYLADGTLDKDYGTEGFTVRTGLIPAAAARQPDDKIVVAGWDLNHSTGSVDMTLVRYKEDGSLDQSFGVAGTVTTDFGAREEAHAVVIQPDGKIVVAGDTWNAGRPDFALARYQPDGTLDGSFGAGGKVTTDFGGYDTPAAMALQGDGKIVVVGMVNIGTNDWTIALARYHPDGSLDPTFDGDGKLTHDPGDWSRAADLAIQSDGKLVVAGTAVNQNTRENFTLLRYNEDGSPDNSFDGDGKLITDFFGSWDNGRSLAIQADGKLVVAGSASNPGSNSIDLALVRYNKDGSLDAGFGEGGKVMTDFWGTDDGASSLVLQPDGKLVVAGVAENPDVINSDFVVLRYNSDGSVDPSFSGDGKLAGYYPVAVSLNNALAVQPDGKVVVAGRTDMEQSKQADFGLARYNSDGSPDAGFGTGGALVTDFYGFEDEASAVTVQPDGKIVVAGWANYSQGIGHYAFALARYNSDGVPDPSFDGDGKVTTVFGDGSGQAASVAIQPDGKIVVAGTVQYPPDYHADIALVRYNKDGSLDAGFGEGGKVTTDLWGAYDRAYSLAIQGDGKLVVAGVAEKPGSPVTGFALARYTTEGILDNSFGEGGRLITDFGSVTEARSLAIQPDGKLVVAGRYYVRGIFKSDIALARYYPDGAPDSSFHGDGRFTTSVRDHDLVNSLALQGDGRMIVAGFAWNENRGNLDLLLYRVREDGTPDTSFGEGGVVIQDFGSDDVANAVAVGRNRIYVAGVRYVSPDRGLIAAYRTGCGDTEICGNRVDDDCDGQVDEGCSAQPFLTINDVTVSEDLQRATLMVTLSKKVDMPVSFSYFTVDRTATSKPNKKGEADYTAKSGTLTIAAGQQTAVISIDIIKDNNTEGEEYFDVHLQRPVNAALAGDKGRVTIQDGEPSVGLFVTVPGKEREKEPGVPQKLSVTAQPNPSAAAFTLVLQSLDRTPLTVKVVDAAGRLVETRSGVAANTTLQIGRNYRPGVYYAEVVQGRERVSIRLVKQVN